LSQALALEVVRDGVTVNIVAPGYVATGSQLEFEAAAAVAGPFGGSGTAGEIAACGLFFAHGSASLVTRAGLGAGGGPHRPAPWPAPGSHGVGILMSPLPLPKTLILVALCPTWLCVSPVGDLGEPVGVLGAGRFEAGRGQPADLARAQGDCGPWPHRPVAPACEQDEFPDCRRHRVEPGGAVGGDSLRIPGPAQGQMGGEALGRPT